MLQNLGFWILNDVIWVKSNPMPNFVEKDLQMLTKLSFGFQKIKTQNILLIMNL